MQPKLFGGGGVGRLYQSKMTDQGLVGGVFSTAFQAVNGAVCGLFGPRFLPLMLKNNRCPKDSLASDTFESFGKFCECLRSKPHLRNCLTSAAFTLGLDIPGISDVTICLGNCCNIDMVSITN